MRAFPLAVLSTLPPALAHLRAAGGNSDLSADPTASWRRPNWDGDAAPTDRDEEAEAIGLSDGAALDTAPARLRTDAAGFNNTCNEVWLTGFIGRLGNRIIQIVNALGVAEKMGGADFKIQGFRTFTEPLMRQLFSLPKKGDLTFHVQPNLEAQSECKIDNWEGLNKVGDERFCKANGFWDLRCRYGFQHRTRLVQKYLLPYLNDTVKQCAREFRDKEKHSLVIHLRGGDTGIYHSDFHACHSQPACSIYDDIIENRTKTGSAKKRRFDRILLATDGGNRCAEHIMRKYGEDYEVKYTSSSSSFLTDACALVGARNVVWARSGFSALFMMLNPDRDYVFLPLAHRGDYDAAGDYCDVWNLNHGICEFVKEGYFYYQAEWNHKETTVDKFAGTCSEHAAEHNLGPEPLRRKRV